MVAFVFMLICSFDDRCTLEQSGALEPRKSVLEDDFEEEEEKEETGSEDEKVTERERDMDRRRDSHRHRYLDPCPLLVPCLKIFFSLGYVCCLWLWKLFDLANARALCPGFCLYFLLWHFKPSEVANTASEIETVGDPYRFCCTGSVQ